MFSMWIAGPSHWVCVLSLAGIVFSNLAGACRSVCCEFCVLSGRGLCVGLITRPEEPYVYECDHEAPNVGHDPESSRITKVDGGE
jgi:hypothetical protein